MIFGMPCRSEAFTVISTNTFISKRTNAFPLLFRKIVTLKDKFLSTRNNEKIKSSTQEIKNKSTSYNNHSACV